MPAQRHVFTSESVTEGHPDKIADQISDAVLDAIIAKDPAARVACETLVTTGMAVVAGEITTSTYVHIPDIVRGTISAIGYTDASFGFDAQTCAILTTIDRQSGDIALGVDRGGAGDQGMMFGYASDETPSLMPLPIVLAHRFAERLAAVRKAGDLPWLRPDGKTQVSVVYEGMRPVGISKVVVSTQHSDKIDNVELREGVIALVVRPDHERDHTLAQLHVVDLVRVLGGHYHLTDPDRPHTFVHDADLGLAVGAEPREIPCLAHRGEPLREAVGQHYRERHERRRLIRRVTEHHPLVARAPSVHAQGDVARLAVDGGEDGAGLGVEAEARVRVADRADRPPHDVGNVDVRGGGDLPGDDGHARGDERLAGHAGGGGLGDDRVEDRVRDLVGDLVGMTFRHRLGGEDVALRGHVPVRPRVRRSS